MADKVGGVEFDVTIDPTGAAVGASKVIESNENIDNLSNKREPQFRKETLFLEVLIEGKVNLYLYSSNLNPRLFYKKEESNTRLSIKKRIFCRIW